MPDITGVYETWKGMNYGSAGALSAVGYFFGAELCTELGVTIGLICTARGGTMIHEWIPECQQSQYIKL